MSRDSSIVYRVMCKTTWNFCPISHRIRLHVWCNAKWGNPVLKDSETGGNVWKQRGNMMHIKKTQSAYRKQWAHKKKREMSSQQKRREREQKRKSEYRYSIFLQINLLDHVIESSLCHWHDGDMMKCSLTCEGYPESRLVYMSDLWILLSHQSQYMVQIV